MAQYVKVKDDLININHPIFAASIINKFKLQLWNHKNYRSTLKSKNMAN